MEGNKSYGNGSSWADQWDYSDQAAATTTANEKKRSSGGATAKYKQKVGDGLEKTKSVASTGMKKVKQGTSSGLQWIKDKGERSDAYGKPCIRQVSDSLFENLRDGSDVRKDSLEEFMGKLVCFIADELKVNVKARKPARREVRYGDLGIGTPMLKSVIWLIG
ncbi:hypothetical protein Godav_005847 [Gossypium davidsonii]|uniref:Uncharacterized protein n=1 Tax=Gossypium davidsonii TaxID=34287 RepID=A0A7J8S3B7_GOSDV|nr:hypothetical protein [Gossypium davidsonii]